MATLSQLKDALTALGVSTATGNLRGEVRRDELARRLHYSRVANSEVGDLTEVGGEEEVHGVSQGLDKLSLSELRSALELRQISTQTPGLKGEARRHALIQRLMNAYSSKTQNEEGRVQCAVRERFASSRNSSSDEDEADDNKSETSSSAYSTATEFIFYDTIRSKVSAGSEIPLKATALLPHLSFTTLTNERVEAQTDFSDSGANEKSTEQLQRELFELRTKLHTTRQEQQQLVDRSLQDAGIETSLGDISAKLQALEHERRRLQDNYFGHELITSDVLLSSGSSQIPLEFVQEDALLLIEKRQYALKQLAERTKEAMAIAKFHALEIELGISKSARQEEENLLQQIRQVESSLCLSSSRGPSSEPQKVWKSPVSPQEAGAATGTLVLARCRSIQDGLRPDLWEQMDVQERRQLHRELRTAASFHIRRGRVSLSVPESVGASPRTARVPSQADKLGIKARFMERAKRNPDEIRHVYQKALELDGNHAQNLGNYALFLFAYCGQVDQAHDYFQRALTADPTNAQNLANYATFLMRERGDYVESDVYFKRALQVAPKDVNIVGGFADSLSANPRGNRENLMEARRVLKEALALSPLHTKNQLRLALVLADLKENELAERCFEQLIIAVRQQYHAGKGDRSVIDSQTDHETLASICEKYANFLHRCGQWARAKRMYDEALVLDPQRLSLLRNL